MSRYSLTDFYELLVQVLKLCLFVQQNRDLPPIVPLVPLIIVQDTESDSNNQSQRKESMEPERNSAHQDQMQLKENKQDSNSDCRKQSQQVDKMEDVDSPQQEKPMKCEDDVNSSPQRQISSSSIVSAPN